MIALKHLSKIYRATEVATAALRDINYAGWVTVELYPYETTAAGVAKQAFDYLTPLLNER